MQPNDLFIVAEIGANHDGDMSKAFYLIDAAKYAGADAVKFQTYTPEEISANVVIPTGPWAGMKYRDLYKKGTTPWRWHDPLFQYARGQGLTPFSAPFSEKAVDLLETIECPIYKIASPEITHLDLISKAGKTGKPLIISTGMATQQEIGLAWQAAVAAGSPSVTMMHCISAYPAGVEDANMATLASLVRCGYHVGISDHTPGYEVPIMAVAMGARVIEKHITIDRSRGGLDAAFSMEPDEFKTMVEKCRLAYSALGRVKYGCRDAEADSYQYRRSIWVVKPVKSGCLLKPEHVAILRPNYGLAPSCMGQVIGKTARVDIPANTPLNWEYLK